MDQELRFPSLTVGNNVSHAYTDERIAYHNETLFHKEIQLSSHLPRFTVLFLSVIPALVLCVGMLPCFCYSLQKAVGGPTHQVQLIPDCRRPRCSWPGLGTTLARCPMKRLCSVNGCDGSALPESVGLQLCLCLSDTDS